MSTSVARVETATPERYLKQLCSHFGNKISSEYAEGKGRMPFEFGTAEGVCEPGVLVLTAEAADDEALERLESVVGRHLERFGQRNELTCTWSRA